MRRLLGHPEFGVQDGCSWYEIDDSPGHYNWYGGNGYFANAVDYFQSIGAELILNVKTCPLAYRLWKPPLFPDNLVGSPPATDYYDEFADFIVAAMTYSGARIVEIGNEPNTRRDEVPPEFQDHYGAWMDTRETYYNGGKRYGEIISAVAPIIRNTYPDAIIVAGAMIWDNETDENSIVSEYISGTLSVTEPVWDYVSFHPYLYRYQVLTDTMPAFTWPFTMANELYILTGTPVVFSETAIVVYDDNAPDSQLLRDRQREWAEYLIDQVPSTYARLAIWYNLYQSIYPWRQSALVRGPQYGQGPVCETPAYIKLWDYFNPGAPPTSCGEGLLGGEQSGGEGAKDNPPYPPP